MVNTHLDDMPRSPRRQTMYAHGSNHNIDIDKLPIAVAKSVTKATNADMRQRHERQRQELASELSRLEARMNSEAFTNDIRRRLANIRAHLNKSPTKKRKKSVRFAANVKKDSKHRVMN